MYQLPGVVHLLCCLDHGPRSWIPHLYPFSLVVQQRSSPPHRKAGCAIGMPLEASRPPPGPLPNRYYLFSMLLFSATTTCSLSPMATAPRPMPSSPVGAHRYPCLSPPMEFFFFKQKTAYEITR